MFAEFVSWKTVAQITEQFLSLIALNHNHKHENELIKGDGGAVGLTDNPTALKRWMAVGPEIARMVSEFEFTFELTKPCDKRHYEHREGMRGRSVMHEF